MAFRKSRHFGKPAAAARAAAQATRAPTYQGGPCSRGHSGRRYTASGACLACHQEREREHRLAHGAAAHNTLLAVLYETEFDAMGWSRAGLKEGV